MNFKLDRRIKNSSLSIYNNTEIDKVLSSNSKNIIFAPSLKATKNLYKNLSEKGIKINFYQKTGGKEEIQNATYDALPQDYKTHIYHCFESD